MGNSQAKEEPMTFYGSNVSFSLSNDLLHHLQGKAQREKLARPSNGNETGQAQPVDLVQIEALVAERVDQELQQLFSEHPELSGIAQDPHRNLLNQHQQQSSGEFHSTEEVAQELQATVSRFQQAASTELPAAVKEAHHGVVQCYRTKNDRPLDCWQEVEDFKQRVREAQTAKWQ
ncbi:hypothetical protein H4R34_001055 [Dimargaris verticillata]|uniref:Uncharacterized protein n=1 Tax=Dimargaris verticillata TaxID=2761393 RepID=A0A9W8EE56_9FUNG|nr:hypothetical protein H4R34_001055 [Dimargaris verticillata]